MKTETIRVNGSTYDVPVEVAAYMQYQEDTIKQLRASLEKQENDWKKAFHLLRQRLGFAAAVEVPEV